MWRVSEADRLTAYNATHQSSFDADETSDSDNELSKGEQQIDSSLIPDSGLATCSLPQPAVHNAGGQKDGRVRSCQSHHDTQSDDPSVSGGDGALICACLRLFVHVGVDLCMLALVCACWR